MPIVMLVGVCLCIINMILWQSYRVGLIANNGPLMSIDYITGISFSIEFVYMFFDGEISILERILNLENVVNMLVIFEIFW